MGQEWAKSFMSGSRQRAFFIESARARVDETDEMDETDEISRDCVVVTA